MLDDMDFFVSKSSESHLGVIDQVLLILRLIPLLFCYSFWRYVSFLASSLDTIVFCFFSFFSPSSCKWRQIESIAHECSCV